ncbi:MAG: hypothetical protein M3Z97_04520, partial [Candidatus Dormibacteraeota bacterium]|nr:hypothetical protein [Candidatus Dormibacteraeota bacterium]
MAAIGVAVPLQKLPGVDMKLPPFLRGRPTTPPSPRPSGRPVLRWAVAAALVTVLIGACAAGVYSGRLLLPSGGSGGTAARTPAPASSSAPLIPAPTPSES